MIVNDAQLRIMSASVLFTLYFQVLHSPAPAEPQQKIAGYFFINVNNKECNLAIISKNFTDRPMVLRPCLSASLPYS
jgi:hypothetical protein